LQLKPEKKISTLCQLIKNIPFLTIHSENRQKFRLLEMNKLDHFSPDQNGGKKGDVIEEKKKRNEKD
jgi:hypothetical protein